MLELARSRDETAVKMLFVAVIDIIQKAPSKPLHVTGSLYFPLDPGVICPLVLHLTGFPETQPFSVLM